MMNSCVGMRVRALASAMAAAVEEDRAWGNRHEPPKSTAYWTLCSILSVAKFNLDSN
jgi:hypothetical protein